MSQDTHNPYTTPQAETILSPSAQVDPRTFYVEGKLLVVSHGAELPNLCIKTGIELPDAKRKKKTLYWAHPAWAFLLLTGLIIYLIVYLCIRKKVTFTYSLSKQAKRKTLGMVLACLFLTFGSLAASIFFFSANDPTGNYDMFGAAGIVLFIIGLIVTAMVSGPFRVKKHKDGWFYIVGAGKEFLRALESNQAASNATPIPTQGHQ